jgi:hypothetical protein
MDGGTVIASNIDKCYNWCQKSVRSKMDPELQSVLEKLYKLSTSQDKTAAG